MNKNDRIQVDYNEKVLEVKNLKKYFYSGAGKNKLVIPAVDGVTFDVYKKEVFGLVGESGCGKTTTGRTIIKLYSPTDGSCDLDGVTISGGYTSNQEIIRKIKKDTKNTIKSFNANLREKVRIRENLAQQVSYYEAEIRMIEVKTEKKIEDIRKNISEYNEKIYDLVNGYLIDADKLKYANAIARQDIKNEMTNPSLVEYENELKIAKNTYVRKVDGLMESSALTKEVIKERVATLTAEYHDKKEQLKVKYEPLIAKDGLNLLDKKVGQAKLKELKKQLKVELDTLEKTFEANKAAISKPDEKAVKEKIKAVEAEAFAQITEVANKIKSLKADAKAEIKALPKGESLLQTFKSHKNEILEVRKAAKEKIDAQKEIINEIKTVNRSNDALEASRKMQMIFQDPISSLNPRMTVKEIIGEGLKILGQHTQAEIDQKVADVLTLVGLLPEYATRYPHEFSGGQRQRIGVARALIMDPSVIIADEPISALDVSISAQVINLLSELREKLGLTILFVAHDLSVVKFFCDRIAVMYYGKIVELASSEELFENPMHPYTVSLLSAIPEPDPNYEKGRKRTNYDPSMHDYRLDKPSLREVAPGHQVYANDAEFKEIKARYDARVAAKK